MEQQNKERKEKKASTILVATIALALVVVAVVNYRPQNVPSDIVTGSDAPVVTQSHAGSPEDTVLPQGGVTLPVSWGMLGVRLVADGVIDATKLKALYGGRDIWPDEYQALLLGQNDGKLVITKENSGYLLNLFWALGLANKNPILDSGEMTNPVYGGAQNFASTGGWTLAQGSAMDHYSRHKFFDLTPEQQALVDKVSKGIYRPCCGNSTHFPDCNHGMAMLGLLELMASQGVNEQDMWKAALAVNSYWFPDTYLTIATYKKSQGIDWKNVDPKEVLGVNYSSAQGYAEVAALVTKPEEGRSDGACGV